MELTGERRIAAPAAHVWRVLQDPVTLRACVPRCESLEKTGINRIEAVIPVKLGPITKRFNTTLTLTDITPDHAIRFQGEGGFGASGKAQYSGMVTLAQDGTFTRIRYSLRGETSGKVADPDIRIGDSGVQGLVEDFFNRLEHDAAAPAEIGADGPVGMIAAAAHATPYQSQPTNLGAMMALLPAAPLGYPLVFWMGSAVFFCIFALIFSAYL